MYRHIQSKKRSVTFSLEFVIHFGIPWSDRVVCNRFVRTLLFSCSRTYLRMQSRALIYSCSARWYSDESILTCSRVIDIPVRSFALLQLVNLRPRILRHICEDNCKISTFLFTFSCMHIFKLDIMSDNVWPKIDRAATVTWYIRFRLHHQRGVSKSNNTRIQETSQKMSKAF